MTSMAHNFIQEQLSLAYVRAVIYQAGWRLSFPEVDDHGIDGTLEAPVRGMNKVDFQLKATTVYTTQVDQITYDLRVQDYNRLIVMDDVPRVLILFLMPDDPAQWLSHTEDELCLRKCAYWVSLMGLPISSNASTQRVHVPLNNLFRPDGLRSMFDQVRR